MNNLSENKNFTQTHVSDLLGLPKRVLQAWQKNGKLIPDHTNSNNEPVYTIEQLRDVDGLSHLFSSNWEEELSAVADRDYTMIELFAGAGGLALGLEMAGLKSILLNEIDKHAANTLKLNRPDWNVINDDVSNIDFTEYRDKVDILTGGFPCQAFSYAGKQLGFEDTRGTLFFEYARAIKEVNPKVIMAENVKGLISHDNGNTLSVIKGVIDDLGYDLIEPEVMRAIFYQVPQKRERLILVAIRKDLANQAKFSYPDRCPTLYMVADALKAGKLFSDNCPVSRGTEYPQRKKEIMDLVPAGGYWKDLPIEIQKEYMKKSFHLGGGKTGMARRLSWDAPSLTLTCSPAQKQTERCHPEETRPLQVREYARIQTFPDNWEFSGPISAQYKQIGNAVPVNLSHAMGRSLVRLLNDIYKI
jgi:DNA (cytosine-5)-methyltransferase 1